MNLESGKFFTSLAHEGQIYKYHITRANGHQLMKIDPLLYDMRQRPELELF